MVLQTVLLHRGRWTALISLYPHMLMPVLVASTRKARVLLVSSVCHYQFTHNVVLSFTITVALSTSMESEMMATSTGTQLTLFARNVFSELAGAFNIIQLKYGRTTCLSANILCIKNQSGIYSSFETAYWSAFSLYQWSSQQGCCWHSNLHIPGDSNPANLLTKTLPQPRFHFYRNALMRIDNHVGRLAALKTTSRQFVDNQWILLCRHVCVWMYM